MRETFQTELPRKAVFRQIGTFCILSVSTRVKMMLSLETITEVSNAGADNEDH